MLGKGLLLTVGGLAARLLTLLRSVILARLIPVEDFGIVSTLVITVAFFELMSALALDRLLVQAKDGDDSRVIGTLHTLQFLRGLLGAVILFAFAPLYARLLGMPDLVWPYQLMALVPLLRGLSHMGLHAAQRQFDFRPFVKWEIGYELAAVVALAVFWLIFDDWRLGLAAIGVQQLAFFALSHLFSRQPYRMAWAPDIAVRGWRFGWPLLVNGLLLFAVFNGDRLIVANQRGMEVLAIFTVAFSLPMLPCNVLGRAHQTLFLPKLSGLQDAPARFRKWLAFSIQSRFALGLLVALGFALLGADLMQLIYGEKYAAAGELVVWTALLHTARMIKAAPSAVMVALADTRNAMKANLLRVAVLPLAFLAVMQGASLVTVIGIGIVGELLGLALALYLAHRKLAGGLPRPVLQAVAVTLGLLGLIAVDVVLFPPGATLFASFHAFQAVLIVAAAAAILSMSELRAWVAGRLAARLAPLIGGFGRRRP